MLKNDWRSLTCTKSVSTFCTDSPTPHCQCPLSGESHFYEVIDNGDNGEVMCQCPSSGESHFYGALLETA